MIVQLALQSADTSNSNPAVPTSDDLLWAMVSMGLMLMVPVVLILVALYDLLDYPDPVWKRAGLDKIMWLLIAVIIPVLGPMAYLIKARPRLRAEARLLAKG